jgi:hypothetical protein
MTIWEEIGNHRCGILTEDTGRGLGNNRERGALDFVGLFGRRRRRRGARFVCGLRRFCDGVFESDMGSSPSRILREEGYALVGVFLSGVGETPSFGNAKGDLPLLSWAISFAGVKPLREADLGLSYQCMV